MSERFVFPSEQAGCDMHAEAADLAAAKLELFTLGALIGLLASWPIDAVIPPDTGRDALAEEAKAIAEAALAALEKAK